MSTLPLSPATPIDTLAVEITLKQIVTIDRRYYPPGTSAANICLIEQRLLQDEPEYFFSLAQDPQVTVRATREGNSAPSDHQIGDFPSC